MQEPNAASMERPVEPASAEKSDLLVRMFQKPEFGPLVLLIIELVVFYAINPQFLSVLNISNTLAFSVELGLVALAMTLLMTSGEFDLSVGSLFGLAPVLMWTLFNSEPTDRCGRRFFCTNAAIVNRNERLFGKALRRLRSFDPWARKTLVTIWYSK